jgi:competence protein ComEC
MNGFIRDDPYIHYMGKSILRIDETISFTPAAGKVPVDLLVISKSPNLNFKKLAASVSPKQVVFDASVPAWKVRNWKKDCDSLKIPWHDVTVKGAFVVNFR